MSSLDDIWDAPVLAPATSRSPKTPRRLETDDENIDAERPAKRIKKGTLFFSDSEDDENGGGASTLRRGVVKAPEMRMDEDVEALFVDAENDEELSFKPVQAFDADALEREAEARHRKEMLATEPSSSAPQENNNEIMGNGAGGAKDKADNDKGNDTKKKRPVALNENLLLGPTGFPDLMGEIRGFKVKGKGREVEDLNRLMRIYHFWTHKLYPKTKFRDTVLRVEKLCHTKRMQVALSVWRDEAHGKIRQDNEDLDGLSDSDDAAEQNAGVDANDRTDTMSTSRQVTTDIASFAGPSTPSSAFSNTDLDIPPPSSRASSQTPFTDDADFLNDTSMNPFKEGASAVRTKRRVMVDDDEEQDFWKELDSANSSVQTKQVQDDLEDEDMWAAIDEANDKFAASKSAASNGLAQPSRQSNHMDVDDEDMWDIIRENEKTVSGVAATASSTSIVKEVPVNNRLYDLDPEWEDMYAD